MHHNRNSVEATGKGKNCSEKESDKQAIKSAKVKKKKKKKGNVKYYGVIKKF